MPELGAVLLIALLPGAGNAVGGLLAEVTPRSEIWLNRALHAAAGVVIAVVAVEIMPAAVGVLSGWVIGVAFATGGAAYLAVEAQVEKLATESGGRQWMIYAAVVTDLLGDGLLIGAGSAVSPSLGLLVASGQVLADLPEGFAAASTFRANGVGRRQRLWLATSFFFPVLVGAAGAFAALRGRPESWQHAALVATAGLFTVALFEDIIQEAHEVSSDERPSTVALIAGFVLFVFVSAALAA